VPVDYFEVGGTQGLSVSSSLKGFGEGMGSAAPEGGYAWYASI